MDGRASSPIEMPGHELALIKIFHFPPESCERGQQCLVGSQLCPINRREQRPIFALSSRRADEQSELRSLSLGGHAFQYSPTDRRGAGGGKRAVAGRSLHHDHHQIGHETGPRRSEKERERERERDCCFLFCGFSLGCSLARLGIVIKMRIKFSYQNRSSIRAAFSKFLPQFPSQFAPSRNWTKVRTDKSGTQTVSLPIGFPLAKRTNSTWSNSVPFVFSLDYLFFHFHSLTFSQNLIILSNQNRALELRRRNWHTFFFAAFWVQCDTNRNSIRTVYDLFAESNRDCVSWKWSGQT